MVTQEGLHRVFSTLSIPACKLSKLTSTSSLSFFLYQTKFCLSGIIQLAFFEIRQDTALLLLERIITLVMSRIHHLHSSMKYSNLEFEGFSIHFDLLKVYKNRIEPCFDNYE